MQRLLDDMRRNAIKQAKESLTYSEGEIRELATVIRELLDLSNITRMQGLLALEERAVKLSDRELLEAAAMFVVDGTEPKMICEILSTRYWLDYSEGFDGVVNYMYIRGMLAVQDGYHPLCIGELLYGLVPRLHRQRCKDYVENAEAEKEALDKDDVEKKYRKLNYIPWNAQIREAVKEVEEDINYLSDAQIQRVLREVEHTDLKNVMCGMTRATREILLRNMSPRFREMMKKDICDEFTMMGDRYSIEDDGFIGESAEKILETIKYLEAMGEIIIMRI